MTTLDVSTESGPFGDLEIHWDARVLRPRAWTTAQSHWAAALAPHCPDGPILELCCGAGQIGLLAAHDADRSLVQVDRDPVATAFARRNAAAAGIESEIRTASLGEALAPGEEFGLIILDPPWVPSAEVKDYAEDPIGAIDGGADGTEQLVLGMGVALRHLHQEGHLVVQVGNPDQVAIARTLLEGLSIGRSPRAVLEVRDYLPGGMLLDIGPAPDATP